MYIRRMVEGLLKEAILQFPVCLVTGARQVGKSTLLRHLLPEYKYVSLDDPRIRKMAKDDPELFLTTYASPVIIDEIQYVPELLSYIKLKVDAKRSEYGRFILTGSQIFQVMTGVTESLAGRICIFNLYPFSFKELNVDLFDDQEVFKAYLKGFYPEFYDNANLDPSLWFSSYISTYLERDVRSIKAISDLSKFQTFISLLATRAGQILNISSISKECGVTQPTCKSWLSILESTYIIYLLKPYYKNHKKRLIKSPKLYFVDTGILCYLLGIDNVNRLLNASERGAIFENMVVMEVLKRFSNVSKRANLFYWRNQNKVEIDLIIESSNKLVPFEIKFSKTISKNMAKSLNQFVMENNLQKGFLLSLSKEKTNLYENVVATHWSNFSKDFESIVKENQ